MASLLKFTGHLKELRSRFIRSTIYLAVGTAIGWICYTPVFQLVGSPITDLLERSDTKFLVTGVTEGFMLKMQVSFLVGLILSAPFISCEVWGFIRPGLNRTERKAMMFVAPLSVFLFALGVTASYLVLPVGLEWLVAQNPPHSTFMPSVGQSMLFVLKMGLAFGLVFQMPVVLMFLGKVGIINAALLKARWKEAVVIISIVTAVATPSNDALSMIMMCVPMLVLYFLSIVLVARTAKRAS